MDIYLFKEGKHLNLADKFGAHHCKIGEENGLYFAVFAPGAKLVEVIGDFNNWEGSSHPLFVRWDKSGIWEGFIPNVDYGTVYKYRIYSNHDEKVREKADPFSRFSELMPKTASIAWKGAYEWQDKDWMSRRGNRNNLNGPISVYELHLGSWKKEYGYSLSYRALAKELAVYVKEMGFTHVEFLPLTEHPFYPSWGYLSTSFFATSSRFGKPEDLKFLIDTLHQAGIGVIMDWVPGHFPADEFALADFDGTALFEHPDPKKGFHPDWNSLIFNFERPEIVSFLLSSAHFWLAQFHLDGLRVDAVSSMLYLDYSRDEGAWEPNEFGGNEYLAAIEFLQQLNKTCYARFPNILMMAEESTSFPGVTKPVDQGGLGFGLKWMMGWMNDTLSYFKRDPIHRSHHQNEISFSLTYAFSENFILPLSHDEVVHGKGSILGKMPGDEWQKFANLRLLYLYMFTHPGQKLNFMGNEFGQGVEWNVNHALDWHLLEIANHAGLHQCFKDLNHLYCDEEALYRYNYHPDGFQWIAYDDNENCVLSYIRKGQEESCIIVCNFTPVPRLNYRIGVPPSASCKLLMNSDELQYGGSGFDVAREVASKPVSSHNFNDSIVLNLPPLAGLIYKMDKHD